MGLLTLRISDEQLGRVKLYLQNTNNKNIQLQTHPNIDKELFRLQSVIGLKNPAKSFPLNTGVGVLKWRYQTTEDTAMPININCWPSDNGSGGCDVNIEFELEDMELELQDAVIDKENSSGSMEFSVGGNPDDFFPVTMTFNS